MDQEHESKEGVSLADFLLEVQDCRHKRGIRHPLLLCFSTIIWGYCSGIESLSDIAFAAQVTEESTGVFSRYFSLPYGIPTEDTLYRVMANLDTYDLNVALVKWVALTEKTEQLHFTVDGKVVKAAREKSKGQKHAPGIVNIVIGKSRMAIAALPIKRKKSEITVVPRIIRLLGSLFPGWVKGSVFSTDALSTQVEAFRAVKEVGAYFLSPVKNNQKTLRKRIDVLLDHRISLYRENMAAGRSDDSGIEFKICRDPGKHGRDELRILVSFRFDDMVMIPIPGFEDIKTIGRIIRLRRRSGKKTSIKKTDYQCTKSVDVEEFFRLIREHWDVETKHNTLDVDFGEDRSTSKKGKSVVNLGILRRISSNLLTASPELQPYETVRRKQIVARTRSEIILEAIFNPLG